MHHHNDLLNLYRILFDAVLKWHDSDEKLNKWPLLSNETPMDTAPEQQRSQWMQNRLKDLGPL